MINRIIEWSLRNRFSSCAARCCSPVSASARFTRRRWMPFPNLSENQVIVYAELAGRSPQEVEDQVTYRCP